jgi:endonuclease III
MNPEKRLQIFTRLRAENPTPTTELNYSTPFELLIAVILSAQATDVGVNKATAKLYPVANTPAKILSLGLDRLKDYIKTIGLYNAKAENVIKTCQILVEQHGGNVPRDREALEALPGVGRKTANVVLNTAFGEPTIAVDTHIFRLANRINLAPGKTPLAVEQKLLKVVPEEFKKDAHHWLILHGRYICTARAPKCAVCVINDLCEYKQKTPLMDEPSQNGTAKPKADKAPARTRVAVVGTRKAGTSNTGTQGPGTNKPLSTTSKRVKA